MATNVNSFESGQPAGTAISTGNSGGTAGRAADSLVGTVTYDTAHAHSGTLSMKVDMAGGASSQWRWSDGADQAGATGYLRFYLWLAALPSQNTSVAYVLDHSNVILLRVRVHTDGTVDLLDQANAIMGTTAAAVATGQWVRLEAKVTCSATTGQAELRLYNSADSTTAAETVVTGSTFNTGSTKPGGWRFGGLTSSAAADVFWIDDISSSDVDWIGPLLVPTITIPNQWTGVTGDQDKELALNPTRGNWLVAVISSRVVDGSAPMLSLGDVSRNVWTLVSDNTKFANSTNAGAQIQVEVWACPSVRADGWPFLLAYASAMQISASDVGSVCVNVFEVAGMTGDLSVDAVAVNAPSGVGSITLTAPAPAGGADCLMVATATADSNTAVTTSGTGWTGLTTVTDSNPNIELASAWREATTGGAVTFTLSAGTANWAGVVVSLRIAGTVIAQPNPAWPATRLQVGLGYDLSTPLSRVRWTDQAARYLGLDVTRGIQAELGAAQQGQANLKIKNRDGAYSPRPVALAASATAAGTTTTIKVPDAAAASIHVADFFRLKTSAGALKQLDVFQVVSLASSGGTTTVTFARADGTPGGALATTAAGDVYAGIPIDLYIPWRLLHTITGITYVVASGWLRDLPLEFADAHYSTVQAQSADAIETTTAANPSALRGEIYRRPGLYAYWPCDDSSGVTYAANASGVSNAPLTQKVSKYGAGQMTAEFGAATQGTEIVGSDPDTLLGDAGTGWGQSAGVAADLATKGYALVGNDPGFPSIANGVTIVGCVAGTDLTPIINATADPTVCIVRNADPAAGIGQGSVIKVSIEHSPGSGNAFHAKVTVWDKATHATTVTTCGPVQITPPGWVFWALTFNQTSWALYQSNMSGGLVGSGSCNLVASWSGIDIGGEADAFFHGRFFSAVHAHIAVYGRRLTAQEIVNLGNMLLYGTPPNELSSARAIRKLNTVGYRGTRVINTSATEDSIEDVPSGTVVDLLSTIASWEDSAAFADAANQLQYRSRVTAYQQHPVAVLGDGPGEIPYQPGQTYDYNPTYQYSQTSIANTSISSALTIGTSTLVAIDDVSAAKYPPRTLELATRLQRIADAWHLGWWLLARYAYPRQRVGTVTVSASATTDPARWAFVCGVEVGDVLVVNRRPIGQPAISIRCKVLNVALTFDRQADPAVAQVTLTLAAAPFIVPVANDAAYGVVGGTVLGV